MLYVLHCKKNCIFKKYIFSYSCKNCFTCPLCNTLLRVSCKKNVDKDIFGWYCEYCNWNSSGIVEGNDMKDLQEKTKNAITSKSLNDIFQDRRGELAKIQMNCILYNLVVKSKQPSLTSSMRNEIFDVQTPWSFEDLKTKLDEVKLLFLERY